MGKVGMSNRKVSTVIDEGEEGTKRAYSRGSKSKIVIVGENA
jgi:hypothetical protein